MIPGFEAIVEERIRKAQKEGAFNNLEGCGKPLVFDDTHVPEELRLAHKILKNAGFLPPEIEVKKQIEQTQDLLNTIEDYSPERTRVQKKLNYLLAKLDVMRGSSCVAAVSRDEYRNHLLKKLS